LYHFRSLHIDGIEDDYYPVSGFSVITFRNIFLEWFSPGYVIYAAVIGIEMNKPFKQPRLSLSARASVGLWGRSRNHALYEDFNWPFIIGPNFLLTTLKYKF